MEVCLTIGQGLVILPTGEILSPQNEGPVDIKVRHLDTQQKLQLISQLHRGIIVFANKKKDQSDVDYLREFLEDIQSVKNTTPPEKQQVQQPTKTMSSFQENVEQLRVDMKKILRKKVDVIKREAKKLKPRELDMLIAEEEKWKKRKGLLSFLRALSKDTRAIIPQSLQSVTREDVKHIAMCADAITRKETPPQYRGLISQIEDVEEEEIEVKIE